MNKQVARWGTFLVWIASGAFLIAAIVGYSRLETNVRDLKKERAALVDQMESMSLDRASIYTSLILLRNSASGYSSHVDTINRVLDGHCDESFTQRCQRWLRYGRLLNYHETTLINRINAKARADYAALIPQYGRYKPLIDAIQWHRPSDRMRWYANANEGIAYSLWRMGQPRRADRFVAKAYAQNDRSGVVGLTYLKVLCANHRPKTEVTARYAAIRSRLTAHFGQVGGSDPADAANAKFNLLIFDSDAELLKTCAYSGLATR